MDDFSCTFTPGIPQHVGCILCCDTDVYCRSGDLAGRVRTLPNFSSYG